MSILKSLTVAICGFLGLASTAPAAMAQDAPILIRYTTSQPPGSPTSAPVAWFGEELEKRTNGRVKVQFFWGGALVKSPDTLNAVANGLVEMGKIYALDFKGPLPLWNVGNQAFTSSDPYVSMMIQRTLRKEFPEFNAETDRVGVIVLGGLSTGGAGLLSTKPITKLSELKGSKIRSVGAQAEALKAVSAIPVSVPFAEVYEAFQHGVIDTSTNYENSIIPYRYNEVANNFTYVPLGQSVQGEIINKAFWEKLPDDIKTVIQETMDDMHLKYIQDYNLSAQEIHRKLAEGDGTPKVNFHEFSEEDIAEWKSIFPDPLAAWAKANAKLGDTEAMAKRYRELEEQLTAEVEANGYPKDKFGG
ncbi:C4-dicarboxylate TRAP transporter substrate-binding protein [Paracoccus sp. S1E-3]|uniref:C4-dicarboxylate TRAP transporter substrate-binding protein n=1 Tax=Paracoccus sp. S1E-3 TaxID=2756130 RepID=UPI0015EEE075|nr:C4-dicarboxylate TRAP transporter substrate-binding protein [Paracoccus sp. S1E-3]MBA4489596.1 C4-dicarboxylate TRAP transporter substrate-binding protein [Paracoccus sp. S1E-3]